MHADAHLRACVCVCVGGVCTVLCTWTRGFHFGLELCELKTLRKLESSSLIMLRVLNMGVSEN